MLNRNIIYNQINTKTNIKLFNSMKQSLIIFATLLLGVLAISSCNKKPIDDPIDVDLHYDMVYMLGGNAFDAEGNAHWDAKEPIAMKKTADLDVFVAELDLVRSAENKLIKFCLSEGKEWNETDFLVPALADMQEGQAYAFLKEGVNKLEASRETEPGVLRDHFFGLAKGTSGKYRLEVNPVKLTVTATRLSTIEEPEIMEWEEGMLYLVGDLNGWNIAQPTKMVKNGDVFSFEGVVKAGTFKITTVFDWGGSNWRPTSADVHISKAGISDEAADLYAPDSAAHSEDWKWNVDETGKYQLTLDTKAKTMKVKWLSAE